MTETIDEQVAAAQAGQPLWAQLIATDDERRVITVADKFNINPCLVTFLELLTQAACDLLKNTLRSTLSILDPLIKQQQNITKVLEQQLELAQFPLEAFNNALNAFSAPADIIGQFAVLAQSCPEAQRIIAAIQSAFSNPLKAQAERLQGIVDEKIRAIEEVKVRTTNLLDLQSFLNNIVLAIDDIC